MAGADDRVYVEYKDALLRHFAYTAPSASGYEIDSIYFGGGTPSLLPPEIISELAVSLRKYFHVTNDCEITLEMNPGTSDYDAMRIYLESGVNRLSVGCQSADNDELRMLGRIHTFEDFCQTVDDAKRAGFTNISADLMMALPGQDIKSLMQSIDKIVHTEPKHISVYGLKIEKGTWFDQHKEQLCFPDEDTESELYLTTVANLEKYGYDQYEISNFAQKGYESRHNLKYWNSMPYLGFGPAAYSYFENKRYGYTRDLKGYIEATRTLHFDPIRFDEENLSYEELQEEKILLGLRLKKGIATSEFTFDNSVGGYVQTLIENGLAVYDEGRLSLTPRGMLLDNYITSELLLHLISD